MEQKDIQALKNKYHKGTKIELIRMNDTQAPPTGTIGTVDYVDDIGTIHMIWETGSTLGLIEGIDDFRIIGDIN